MRRLVVFALCWFGVVGLGTAWAAGYGAVEGTVSPIEWAPEVEVCLVGLPESCASPEASGTYQLGAPEGEYHVEFVPSYRSRLLRQFYDHKTTLLDAKRVQVFEKMVTQGVDADLEEGGAIAGTVTSAANGTPLSEVEVCASSAGGAATETCAATDAAGEYEVHSLSPGFYRIGFWGKGASAEYEPWFYDDRPSFLQGTPVEVEAETTMGIDASLAKGAQIRGVVTAAASGARLAGITVCLFAVGGPAPRRCVASDDSGTYAFQGLAGGSYQVGFSLEPAEIGGEATGGQDGFASQFYNGVDTRAQAATVSLLPGQIAGGVNGVLSPLSVPPHPGPPPSVANSFVTALPPVAEPAPKKHPPCNHLRHRVRIKGKVRCVKKTRPTGHKHHRRHPSKKHGQRSR